MDFKTKYIIVLLIGIWQLIAFMFTDNIVLKVIFLVIGVLAVSMCTSAISLYNYHKGYYKEL